MQTLPHIPTERQTNPPAEGSWLHGPCFNGSIAYVCGTGAKGQPNLTADKQRVPHDLAFDPTSLVETPATA